jgi:hypothetical protein
LTASALFISEKFQKKCKGFRFFGSYSKETNGTKMSKNEISRFKSAVREHFIESGSYSHIFMNYSYADVLKNELKCSDAQLTALLDLKDLAIVDGLEEDFVIIP